MCCVSCFVCLFACLLECSPPFKVGLFDFLQIPSPSLSLLLPSSSSYPFSSSSSSSSSSSASSQVWWLPSSGLAAAKLGFGSCQPLVWRLPNSGVAAAKPEGYSIMTWMYPWMCIHGSKMEMEPRITTPCMCGEGCATVATASHAQKCALTWQARSPQGLQKSTAMILSILTSMQEIYLSMVSWLLRHVCVYGLHELGNRGAGDLPPGLGCIQWGSFIWPCAPPWLCSCVIGCLSK